MKKTVTVFAPHGQGIKTKFLGATNFRPSRVKAAAEAGSVIVSWDDGLDVGENHARAVRILCEKFEWGGYWHGAGNPDQTGFMFVCVRDF